MPEANEGTARLWALRSRDARPWTEREKALLGVLPDQEVARRTGRTWRAVTQMRNWLKIPTAKDHRKGHAWRRR